MGIPQARLALSREAAAIMLGAVVILFVVFGAFSMLQVDDYCVAAEALDRGVLGGMRYFYQTWSGRFTQLALSGLLPVIFEAQAAAVAAIALLTCGVVLLHRLYPDGALWIASGFLLALGSAIWQGIYWASGGLTYCLPIILSLLLMVLAKERRNPLFLFVIAFFAAGCHETTGVVLLIAAVLYRQRAIGVGALLGLAVVLLAPGNAVRAGYLHPLGMGQAIEATITALIRWLAPIVVLLPLALVAAYVAGTHYPRRLDWRVFGVGAAAVGSILATVIVFPEPPLRSYVIPTAGLVLLVFRFGQTQKRIGAEGVIAALLLLAAVEWAAMHAGALFQPGIYAEYMLDGIPPAQWAIDCMTRFFSVIRPGEQPGF